MEFAEEAFGAGDGNGCLSEGCSRALVVRSVVPYPVIDRRKSACLREGASEAKQFLVMCSRRRCIVSELSACVVFRVMIDSSLEATPMQSSFDRPLVTIITPTFNAAKTLTACLQSVNSQDYPSLEHIILDAGSKDATLDILREHAKPGSWTSEPDINIFDAWNKGLAKARGEWIAFLGADDRLLPGAVSAYMELARKHPEAEYLSSHVQWVDPAGGSRTIGKPWSWPRFQRYMCTAHVGSMHRRSLFEKYGKYDITLPIVADYEMLLRAGSRLKAAFLPEVTVEMQGGGNSDNLRALDEELRVKIGTGGRAAWLSHLERYYAQLLFKINRTGFVRKLRLGKGDGVTEESIDSGGRDRGR